MEKRRRFSLDVVDTDRFIDMPVSTQCLYFHLGMRAHDDGTVVCSKAIMRAIGFCETDLEIFIRKGYVENGLYVVG